jgi:hypothetical protein
MFQERFSIVCSYVEELKKAKIPSLKNFEDVFQEIHGFPSKRDIYFSIDLVPGDTPVSKTPYRMSTQELKELQMQLK